mmetsp:Transcript_2672/g.3815  ORF Transcript_2672/g.3815 Transcript_2672/m.3815 type:complete len:233 (+) Transcript_2672:2-700(+)
MGGMGGMGGANGGSPFVFQTFGGMPGGRGGMNSGMGGMGGVHGGMGGMGGLDPRFGGMGGFQQPRRSAPTPSQLKDGTIVLIQGLVKQKQHNGSFGQITQYDPSRQRYVVQLDGDDQVLSLKIENLQQIVDNVQITGLQSKPELNGGTGKVFGYNAAKHRVSVHVGHQSVSVGAANVILPVGTVVQILNLSSGAKYNGRWGTISEVHRGDERYTVTLSAHEKIKPRFGNVRA